MARLRHTVQRGTSFGAEDRGTNDGSLARIGIDCADVAASVIELMEKELPAQ